MIPTQRELFIYNLFFAAVSVTIGFGMTVWVWFYGLFSSKRSRTRINFISTQGMFWSMTLIFIVSKFGSNLTWVLFGTEGYDDHLNFAREFLLLLVLLPIVLFFNIWAPIRLSFRAGNWLLKSFGIYLILALALSFCTPVDQSLLNERWNVYTAPYRQLVDHELERAQAYGIQVSEEAVDILYLNHKARVTDQAKELKDSFKSEKPLALETAVLELILVKKNTILVLDGDRDDPQVRWPYALPSDIYRQLLISENPLMQEYLIKILAAYQSIFNDQQENWDEIYQRGLVEKHTTRLYMRRMYAEISLELDFFLDLLEKEKGITILESHE